MVHFRQKGDFSKATRYLKRVNEISKFKNLDKYGQAGVDALASATPSDSGLTAESWSYEVTYGRDTASITFYNSNINKGVPIAIILQYGHGTRNGGWVEGRDYINPAIRPIFDQITQDAWKEVTRL